MTIKRQHYLPYPYAERALELEVSGLRAGTEHLDLDLVVDDDGRTLDLRDYASSAEPVHIDLAIQGLDDTLFAEVLPKSERKDPPLRYVAILRDTGGWYRTITPLASTNEGIATGCIEFSPQESTGFASIEVVAIRTRRSSLETKAGYARGAAMRVATSPEIAIYTRDHPQLPGGSLDIRWEDFKTSTHRQRSRRHTRVYYLESTAEPPILWLNKGIPDLSTVLESKGTTGHKAIVRDLLNQAIAAPVWYGLVHTALLSISLDEEERPTIPEGWRRGLIVQLAPRVFPGIAKERAYNRLLERFVEMQQAHDNDDGAELIESLVSAIQDELDLPRITRRALRDLA